MTKITITSYITTLTAYLILDGIWLGIVAADSYTSAMSGLLRDEFYVWPWVVFYGLYCFAIVHLVVKPHVHAKSFKPVLLSGAVLGMAAYGAYNLTNVAILKDWPLGITLKDWAWGTCVTTASALCGWAAARRYHALTQA